MIHLVTDSTAYLPPEVKDQYHIHTISLNINVRRPGSSTEQTYAEEGGITRDDFFSLLAKVETTPTTSQPSVGEFEDLFQALTRNDDEVLAVLISEGLSGTVPNALSAAQEVAPKRISIVDSRTAAIGLLVLVISAGEALAAGKSRAEVVTLLARMVQECSAYFMVENLAYLHKGGRINTATRFMGTLLNIKPILYIKDGKLEALDKARTSKKARQRVVDELVAKMDSYGPRGHHVRASIAHIQAPEAAAEVAREVSRRLDCKSLHVSEVGPVIGTHVGPGFVGAAACPVSEEGF